MMPPRILHLRALVCFLVPALLAFGVMPASAQGPAIREELLGLYDLGGQWEELEAIQLGLAAESPVKTARTGLNLYVQRTPPEECVLVQVMANDPIVGTIISCGEKAVPYLARVAVSPQEPEEKRMVALFALGKIGGEKAIEAAVALRSDPAWRVRNRAVLALYDLGKADEITPALNDKHWNVRALAALALGDLDKYEASLKSTRDKERPERIEKPDLADIDLRFIARLPRYDCDAEKNTPAPGERVRFVAHIRNAGTQRTGKFGYQWFIDGKPARKGRVKSLKPGQETTIEQKWAWQAGPHTAKCVLDPDGKIEEITTTNNAREDKTTAFAVTCLVEKSRYEADTGSWDDWAQDQIALWNAAMARSVTLVTPEGVADRARLDNIVVVDGGGIATSPPDMAADVTLYFLNAGADADSDAFLVREIGRARGLVDLDAIRIRGGEIDVADSFDRRDYDRFAGIQHRAADALLMGNGSFLRYSEYPACALNRILNKRGAADAGEWLNDLPAGCTFTVEDISGEPLPNAVVLIYQCTGDARGKRIDDTPDLALVTNKNGEFTIEGHPFGGNRLSPNLGNSIVLFKVWVGQASYNYMMDVTEFNLAAWRGGRREARFTIPLELSLSSPHPPRNARAEATEAGGVRLKWEPPETDRTPAYYRIYRREPGRPWQLADKTIRNEILLGPPPSAESEYAVSAISRAQRESLRAPAHRRTKLHPIQIVAGPDDTLTVLEEERLVSIRPDGSCIGAWPHSVEGATAMAAGPAGTIYLAGATWEVPDEKGATQKISGIIVIGPAGEFVARIGAPLNENLALNEPRGLAVDSLGNIVVADTGNDRLLFFNSDGSFAREVPAADPVAVALSPAGRIFVASAEKGLVGTPEATGALKARIEHLDRPVAVAVSPDGRLVVAEAGAGRVRIFDLSGDTPKVVREITEYDGAPLGTPVAVALDRFSRIVVTRAGGLAPAVLPPPTDFTVQIEPKAGFFHKVAPSETTIHLTNISDTPLSVQRITSTIGAGGKARQTDLDKAGRFRLEPGKTRQLQALVGFPWEEPRGVVPAEFQIKTDAGTAYAHTSIELHDLAEHRLVVEKMPVEPGDRWQQYRGRLVVTAYAPQIGGATIEVSTVPSAADIRMRAPSDAYGLGPDSTALFPFEVFVPLDWKGVRAQVLCRLKHLDKFYSAGFDIERPIPWHMIGPFGPFGPLVNNDMKGFSTAYPPETGVHIGRPVMMPDGTQHRWVEVPAECYDEQYGVIFNEAFDEPDWKMLYVTTVLSSPEAREVLLKLATEDALAIWLNGTEVHRNHAVPGYDEAQVTLRKGNNRLLMKVCNNTGPWGFGFVITDLEGRPYYDLTAGDAGWNPPE